MSEGREIKMGESGKQLYFLACFDRNTEEKMEYLRRRIREAGILDEQTPGLPPHLTLATFSMEKLDTGMDLLEKFKTVDPFTVFFPSLGQFGDRVLFLSPELNEDLKSFRDMVSGLETNGGIDWAPHVTLCISDREGIQKARSLSQDLFSPFEGTLEKVYLYEFWPTKLLGEAVLCGCLS